MSLQAPARSRSRRKSQKKLKKTSKKSQGANANLGSAKSQTLTTADIMATFSPSSLRWNNLDWTVLVWMTLMHVGAFAAPFFFSWSAVGIAAVLYWLTASIGICLGYHRCLSHRSFSLSWPAQVLVYLIGCISAQGTPLKWCAVHRLHHQFSDEPGDPHSPKDGTFWSHILWLFVRQSSVQRDALYARYVPDLMRDKTLKFFDSTYILWSFALAGVLGYFGGWSYVLWGMCVRMVVTYHATWLVNSATHLWGYRTYETTDTSRNNWWVAVLSFGEGWHNNHHAHPRVARAGHRWWEVDMTWWAIKAMSYIGFAKNIDDKLPPRPDAKNNMQSAA